MTLNEYYTILGLTGPSTVDEIKHAYRKKARLYHPDINHNPDAKDKFILATEAYEFLIAWHEKMTADEKTWEQAMEDWRKYRQDRSRKRANAYARASYETFRKTKFYRQTRIFDGTTIIFSLIISVLVIVYTIIGYTYRLHHPWRGEEKPSLFTFILLLVVGATFLTIALIYLKAYLDSSKKHKNKK